MALHQLRSIEIGVTHPDELANFYREIGFVDPAGGFGGTGASGQIQITEAPYRQFRRMSVAADNEQDLRDAADRLNALGVASSLANGALEVTDPVNRWQITLRPQARQEPAAATARAMNHPGVRGRLNARAEVITEAAPRTPRRLGHVVLGSPDPKRTVALFTALGFRISDTIGGGVATFMRCSPDHHNLLIAPAPAPYLNHYALEQDDFDAVMKGATQYLEHYGNDQHIAGPGRHPIGGNVFWYMRDPAGNYFEFFTDMDQIVDDNAWKAEDWNGAGHWSVWGEQQQPEALFRIADMASIIEGWQKVAA